MTQEFFRKSLLKATFERKLSSVSLPLNMFYFTIICRVMHYIDNVLSRFVQFQSRDIRHVIKR